MTSAKTKELASYLAAIREKLRRLDKGVSKDIADLSVQEVRAVANIGTAGAITMSALAERVQLSVSSMTTLVDKLEKKKLVVRGRQAADRRVIEVTLTKGGAKAYGHLKQAHTQFIGTLLDALRPDEQDTLLMLFRKIAGNLT
jgi:DNA-binding MarR family transcriptional regulator